MKNGIVFSFDDDFIEGWHDRFLEISDEFPEFKATFFITRLGLKSSREIELIHKLYSYGNEIGNHSYDHISEVDFLRNEGETAYILMLEKCKRYWNDLGINCVSHAYPYGYYTEESNLLAAKVFDNIRGATGNIESVYSSREQRLSFFQSSTMDNFNFNKPIRCFNTVIRELEFVKKQSGIKIYCGHILSNNEEKGLTTNVDILKKTLAYARDNGIEVLTFREACDYIRI